MAPRKTKRARTEASTSHEREDPDISENPEKLGEEDEDDDTEDEAPADPFDGIQATWTYKRLNLALHPHKTMLTGYESMSGDINSVLKKISRDAYREVRKSGLGSYTKLDSFSTRNGNMLHYVVFREVKPEPDPDPTALWFKIGGKIMRFSRTEYALVSGLRFGQAKFNLYHMHTVPEESVFARLFRYNEKTTTIDVAKMFNRRKFTYTEWEGDKKKEIEILVIRNR